MAPRLEPTPEVASARRYAARVRVLLAFAGGALLVIDPEISAAPVAAAIGFAVIALTGVMELTVRSRRWLAVEEALSCVAAVCIVGWSRGRVDVLSVLWLAAAASGVLARGGRVGPVARVLVTAALCSPLVTTGTMSPENIGFALGSIALLLATGRVSREQTELLRRARHDATHDSLTGLLSRGAFRSHVDTLARLATTEAPATLITIDLDGFGAINKRQGHAAGDRVLKDVARAMETVVRDDDLLGRLGGDEFGVMVLGEDTEALAGRLIEAATGAGLPGSSASAGIARCPENGTTSEALLAAADVALRLAKRGPGNCSSVYMGAPMGSDSDGARAALERLCRGEGLEMATQPIVDVANGEVHAYEALARFATRDGQGPLHWLTLADELGMRAELELACLRASLELFPELPAGSRLSVNLSAPLVTDRRTLALLDACPALADLIIEVTEETLVRHSDEIEDTTAGLRERGLRIAVDDVGAGYSGIGQMASLRPSYIKLDRSLVSDIDRQPSRVALVQALADYARRTGGMLVAEGVETPDQLAYLRAAGAPLLQGYLLARPGPPWPAINHEALRNRPERLATELALAASQASGVASV